MFALKNNKMKTTDKIIIDYLTDIKAKLTQINNAAIINNKDFLTIEETSILTGYSTSYLYNLVSKKQIPYYQPNGRRIIFDKNELTNWIKTRKENKENVNFN